MAEQLINILKDPLNINFIFPLLGGLLPPLLWLYFWLKEDLHPEPKSRLVFTFLLGMLSVFPALFLEKFIFFIEKQSGLISAASGTIILLAAWALIEEVSKFLAAFYGGLKHQECDEPIDPPIYLITAALGFAALENVLFLLNIVSRANGLEYLPVFLTGDLRFIGANLLHVATSAFVGISLSLCFFHKHDKTRNLIGGTLIATILHFLFNYFILKGQGGLDMIQTTKIMLPLWAVIVVIIFILEKIKQIKKLKSQHQ